MNSVLSAWATSNKRLETKAIAAHSEADIRSMRDEALIQQARVVLAEVLAAGTDLARFGLPEARVEEFRQCITAFEHALGTRNSCATERKQSSSALEGLFATAMTLLHDEIDPLMEIFRASNPHFYDNYYAQRSIKALAVRYRPNGDKVNGETSNNSAPAVGQPVAVAPLR